MKENLQLITAMRRNHQKRGSKDFLGRLNQATALTLMSSDIVEPALSVQFERSLATAIREKLANGSLVRSSELTWEEASNKIQNHPHFRHNSPLIIFLCCHEDFMIHMKYGDFQKVASLLLQFDKSTIYGASEDLDHGIGLDVYDSELTNERRYTVDLW